MKLFKSNIFIICCLLFISLFFRLFELDHIPSGLNWDEVAYSYNGYSLMQTGKDEYGVRTPMYLISYNDYKPAIMAYMYVPVFYIFGESTMSVRSMPAMLGIISIICFYFLLIKITRDEFFSFLGAILLAISPWHIFFSRVALDEIVTFTFLIIGMSLFVRKGTFFQIGAGIFLSLSIYAYYSTRFFTPLIVLAYLIIFSNRNFKKNIKTHLIPLIMVGLFGSLIILQTLFGNAGTRVRFVAITNEPYIAVETNKLFDSCHKANLPLCRIISNRRIVLAGEIIKHYMYHFQADFLFFDKNIPTVSFPNYGNLLLISLPFLFIGFIRMHHFNKKVNIFFLIWTLLAPIPASLTNEIPHAGRSFIVLPALIYFISLGITSTLNFFEKRNFKKYAAYIIVLAFAINIFFYWKDYLLIFPQYSQYYWQGYFKEVVPHVWNQKEKYDSIYFSNAYANPFMFFAWYNKVDPNIIQNTKDRSVLSNIHFLSQEQINNLKVDKSESSLIVSTVPLENRSPIQKFYSLSSYQPAQTWFYIYSNK